MYIICALVSLLMSFCEGSDEAQEVNCILNHLFNTLQIEQVTIDLPRGEHAGDVQISGRDNDAYYFTEVWEAMSSRQIRILKSMFRRSFKWTTIWDDRIIVFRKMWDERHQADFPSHSPSAPAPLQDEDCEFTELNRQTRIKPSAPPLPEKRTVASVVPPHPKLSASPLPSLPLRTVCEDHAEDEHCCICFENNELIVELNEFTCGTTTDGDRVSHSSIICTSCFGVVCKRGIRCPICNHPGPTVKLAEKRPITRNLRASSRATLPSRPPELSSGTLSSPPRVLRSTVVTPKNVPGGCQCAVM